MIWEKRDGTKERGHEGWLIALKHDAIHGLQSHGGSWLTVVVAGQGKHMQSVGNADALRGGEPDMRRIRREELHGGEVMP